MSPRSNADWTSPVIQLSTPVPNRFEEAPLPLQIPTVQHGRAQCAAQAGGDVRSIAVSRPTILIVSTNADLAGAPSHVRDLTLALKDSFRLVVAFGESGPMQQILSERGVETHIIHDMRSSISPVADIRVIARLRRLIRQVRPALVHAHSTKAGMVARLAGRAEGVPVVYTVHGWGFGKGRHPLRSALVSVTEKLLRPMTHTFLAVSEADARLGSKALHIAPARMKVVANGVVDSTSRARPGSNSDFIMVERAEFQKDNATALQDFARVPGHWRFSCVGGGTEATIFMQACHNWAAAASERVIGHGARSDNDTLLASHGIFVLCSRFEGMPLSIIEAMRAGLPVIASRVGGVGELVIDGTTGILVEPGDVAATAAAMKQLAEDPALRDRMGAAGRRRYEQHFSIDRMTGQITAVYRSIVAGSAWTEAAE